MGKTAAGLKGHQSNIHSKKPINTLYGFYASGGCTLTNITVTSKQPILTSKQPINTSKQPIDPQVRQRRAVR